MTTPCKHPIVKVVAREEDAEFVECQSCGEIFDAVEYEDMAVEEKEHLDHGPNGGDGPAIDQVPLTKPRRSA